MGILESNELIKKFNSIDIKYNIIYAIYNIEELKPIFKHLTIEDFKVTDVISHINTRLVNVEILISNIFIFNNGNFKYSNDSKYLLKNIDLLNLIY